MKINNYRFQQQQKARREHKEANKMREAAKKAPVSAAEELDYIKKLLNGEEVEDFGPEEVKLDGISDIEYWSAGIQRSPATSWATLTHAQMHELKLSDYLKLMGGKGYYK